VSTCLPISDKSGQRNVWDKFVDALDSSGSEYHAQLISSTDPSTGRGSSLSNKDPFS